MSDTITEAAADNPLQRAIEPAIRQAVQELRLGELMLAMRTVTGALSDRVSHAAFPLFSDGIKLSVRDRRRLVAAGLRVMAKELELAAATVAAEGAK